jgi:hypothetical protein
LILRSQLQRQHWAEQQQLQLATAQKSWVLSL